MYINIYIYMFFLLANKVQPKITYNISNNPLNMVHTKTIGCYINKNNIPPTAEQLRNLTNYTFPQAISFLVGKILNAPKVNISYISTENNKSCGVSIYGPNTGGMGLTHHHLLSMSNYINALSTI